MPGHLRHHQVAQDHVEALAAANPLQRAPAVADAVTSWSAENARRSAPRIIGSSSTTSSRPPGASGVGRPARGSADAGASIAPAAA